MTPQNRALTIVFVPDPLLAHAVTSAMEGGMFEMARLFDPESAEHFFKAAPGCWLEKKQTDIADDDGKDDDNGHDLADDDRGTVDVGKEAADAGEGAAEGAQDSHDIPLVFWEWVSIRACHQFIENDS